MQSIPGPIFGLAACLGLLVGTHPSPFPLQGESKGNKSSPAFSFGDYNGDGLPDILTISSNTVETGSNQPRLYRNLGEGKFEEIAQASGLPSALSAEIISIEFRDLDGDRRDECILATKRGPQSAYRFLAETQHFENISKQLPSGEGELTWIDYNGDALPDLVSQLGSEGLIYVNRGDAEQLFSEAIRFPILSAGSDGNPEHAQDLLKRNQAPPVPGDEESGNLRQDSCASSVRDAVNESAPCIEASRTPGLGRLYPLSAEFNIVGNEVRVGSRLKVGQGSWTTNGNDVYVNTGSTNQCIAFRPNGDGSTVGQVVFTAAGAGFGTASPQAKVHVNGPLRVDGSLRAQGGSWTSNGNDIFMNTAAANQQVVIRPNGEGSQEGQVVINRNGVGVGTDWPTAKLHVVGPLRVDGSFRAQGGSWTSNGNDIFLNTSASNQRVVFRPNGEGAQDGQVAITGAGLGVGTLSPSAKLHVVGTTRTCALEITGGCDLAENFEVNEEAVEPGMLVSIDPEQTQKLQLSKSAYDRTVAGVISGAGGVNTGMTLSQEGKFTGKHPVALTGRVYCWADASFGAIRPGDLLTSSITPGHAMKAEDPTRAFGSIVGKALTPLSEGRGLVLVIVSLQ